MEGDVEDGELSDSDSDMPGAGSPGDPQQVRKGRWPAARPRAPAGAAPLLAAGRGRPSREKAAGGPQRPRRRPRCPAAGQRAGGVGRAVLGACGLWGEGARYGPGGRARGAFPGSDCLLWARQPACSSGARSRGETACCGGAGEAFVVAERWVW